MLQTESQVILKSEKSVLLCHCEQYTTRTVVSFLGAARALETHKVEWVAFGGLETLAPPVEI